MLSNLVHIIFNIIYLILLFVILLSWVPIFDVRKEPIASFIKFYKIIMKPFRAIIPPIGMFDISPIVAFLLLQILEQTLAKILVHFGL